MWYVHIANAQGMEGGIEPRFDKGCRLRERAAGAEARYRLICDFRRIFGAEGRESDLRLGLRWARTYRCNVFVFVVE